jgi:hypothetical protein
MNLSGEGDRVFAKRSAGHGFSILAGEYCTMLGLAVVTKIGGSILTKDNPVIASSVQNKITPNGRKLIEMYLKGKLDTLAQITRLKIKRHK